MLGSTTRGDDSEHGAEFTRSWPAGLPRLRPARLPSSPPLYQLPAAPSGLYGRATEIAAVSQALLQRETRLLTLVGPPGVGKTRLALAAADIAQEQFEQGAAFLDLSPLRDPGLVLPSLAHLLGLRQQGGLAPADQLETYLRDASMLLVLDNFEHLLDAGPDVARLLARAPSLTLLVTSRTALHLRWERIYAVPPLAPAASAEVFVECARACRPDLKLGDTHGPAIAEICARLDGLPLAIELAAAQVVLLSPHEILARLAAGLDVLVDGPRDAAARHQTLRRAIDWSYDLLADQDRTLFRRLAVFDGGFTVEGAATLLDRDATPQSAILERLTSLARQNLVRLTPGDEGSPSRFRLLETIREYALEQLEAVGEVDLAKQRHASYVLELVERLYPLNFGPRQPEVAERFEQEHDNLRQALAWSIGSGRTEAALRICGGLQWFWYARGSLTEGTRLLEQALAQAESAPIAAQAVARRAAGALALNQGKFGRALSHLEAAVELGRQRPEEPEEQAELAMALGILSVTHIAAGHYDAASTALKESLALYASLEDEWGIATAKEVLAAVAALQGDAHAAECLATEALVVHRRLGGKENIARALDVLGYAAAFRNEFVTAQACLEESLALRRSVVNRPATAAVLSRLGLVAYLGRHWDTAANYYRESLALAQEVGDDACVVRCLGQVAALAFACGVDRGRVASLGCAVAHHHAALGLPSPPVERIAAERLASALRADLSPIGLAAAWVSGRVLSLEKAAALGATLLDAIAPTRATPAPNSASPERLTRREVEVAALVARGLTNRQIAEELVIAQRTVDTHVERILGKLGCVSRVQIAAWVIERDRTRIIDT
jgi:predicted ATPase/DNA-binding CsgD family transcriptional regulator